MKERAITVKIEMSARTIRTLAAELNDTENPDMAEFLEEVLKAADEAAFESAEFASSMREAASGIMIENPFSQWRLGNEKN